MCKMWNASSPEVVQFYSDRSGGLRSQQCIRWLLTANLLPCKLVALPVGIPNMVDIKCGVAKERDLEAADLI